MVWILFSFFIGALIGFLLRNRKETLKHNHHLVDACVGLLLFLLGASIGSNPAITENLPTLGLQGFLLGLGGMLGSMLSIQFLRRVIHPRGDRA
ncbi:MAG: LysO family transporter [Anaerolineaceae bacterium]|nr:LysO family transporter [Anaerolineaceae bacterium]